MRQHLLAVIAPIALVGVLAAAVTAPAGVINSPIPCLVTSSAANGYRNFVVRVATAPDSASASTRAAWNIPLVTDPADVAFVSDTTVCTQAANALALASGDTIGTPASAHVLRVGATRYIVFNYESVGEFLAYYVFDQNFALLKELMS